MNVTQEGEAITTWSPGSITACVKLKMACLPPTVTMHSAGL